MPRKPSRQMLNVLKILYKNPDQAYFGYEISRMTGIAAGSLYPALYNMEKKGWVKGEWENADPSEEGRARRRYYTLKPLGARVLESETDKVAQLNKALGGL